MGEPASGTSVAFDGWRRIAFYAVTVVYLAFTLVIGSGLLQLLFTGWLMEDLLGIHQLHEILVSGLFWTAVLGGLVQLHRPARRVAALGMAVTVFVALLLVTAGIGSVEPFFAVFLGLLLVIAALHPVRADLLRFGMGAPLWTLLLGVTVALTFSDALYGIGVAVVLAIGALYLARADFDVRKVSANRVQVGLIALAAVPLVLFAASQLNLQLTAGDEHAMARHWALIGAYAVSLAAFGVLAAVGPAGSRIVSWWTAFLAAVLGVASVALPAQASSVGPFWGIAAVAWAIVFAAVGELVHREEPPRRAAAPT